KFFMLKKNFSPQQAALLSSVPLALLASLAVYGYSKLWLPSLILFLLLTLVGYLFIFYIINRFIYRKIKLIYKLIYQTKASKKEEFYFKNILPQKSREEVSADVEQWAGQHKGELEILHKNEVFR